MRCILVYVVLLLEVTIPESLSAHRDKTPLLTTVWKFKHYFDMTDSDKSSWPELVGKDGNEAKEIIMKERPDLAQVHILPENSPVTMDFRKDRVRIFVKEDGSVAVAPRTG